MLQLDLGFRLIQIDQGEGRSFQCYLKVKTVYFVRLRARCEILGLELYSFDWLCYFFKGNSPWYLSLFLSDELRLNCSVV